MKKKFLSILTVAALLVSSIPSLALANYYAGNENQKAATSRKYDENKTKQNVEKDTAKEDIDNKDANQDTVTDSVYEENGKGRGHDKDKEDKVDNNAKEQVTVALYTYGEKDPAEVIDSLLDTMSMKKIAKTINQIAENEDGKYSDLPVGAIEAYSSAILDKLQTASEELTEKIGAIEELTDLYENMGDLEKAINIQKKAIMSDYKNILSYKKIGQVFNKKGDKDIKVFTTGEQVYFDVQPVVKDDRTLVPIRAIAESLKTDVQWDEATQTITLTKDGNEIKLVLGSDTAIVNGQEVKLDVPAETLNGRTLVPVRFISEAFNSTVEWEPEYQIVVIY